MSSKPIYLDYMATTPVDDRVIATMIKYLGVDGEFGNPASNTHQHGINAKTAVELSRMRIAKSVGASPNEIVFTSGATEADNLAIIGSARFYKRKGKHVITQKTEHKAVLDSCYQLENEGFEVTYLEPDCNGIVNIDDLARALREDTILVSIMHANNEIGVIQDIKAIGSLLKGKGIIFHVDAAQSTGKLPINLEELNVSLMSFSAHKNYGPKGIGALYVSHNPRVRLEPLTYGGGHENGMRSGTLATPLIVGMAEAFSIAEAEREEEQARILTLRNKLWHGLSDIGGVTLNGHAEQRLAGNLNFIIDGVDSNKLLANLEVLSVSTTSACSSASTNPSYVLKAIGVSPENAARAIRLSLGRYSTARDVETAILAIKSAVAKLREISV